MISDAYVDVMCDNPDCTESIQIELSYRYRNMLPSSGYYDSSDDSIEKELMGESWVVLHGNGHDLRHFCCKNCANQAK
ncbi:MAG: hypothetical protein GY841_16250 [FCB group bacterium]|nr:hypothetical protein [FCB group bacterium]